MLWMAGRLSALERLSIASYLANGHPVDLYAYGPIEGLPPGARLRDGREILPESAVFTDGKGYNEGGYGAFSDGFRYRLLLERGGLYSDADVVCLKPLGLENHGPYCVALERVPPEPGRPVNTVKMNGCFMMAPAGAAVMRDCFATFEEADKGAIRWGAVGPDLVTRKFFEHGLQRHALPVEAICPVDFWNAQLLATEPLPENPATLAVHFWNGVWRHRKLDKDARYPRRSAFEALKKRYGIS